MRPCDQNGGDKAVEVPEVEALLEENGRRREMIGRPYDPIAGDADDPGRFHFLLSDYEAWLPLAMKREQMTIDLLNFGSFREYASKLKGVGADEMVSKVKADWAWLRSRHDFPFWAASYAHIKRKGGGDDILFCLNRPQRKLVAALEGMRCEGKPIRLLLLKARQWGGSTCVQLYMAWLQLMARKGLNSLVIAHQSVCSDEIKDMFDRMLAQYPEDMLRDDLSEPPFKGKKMESVGKSGQIFRLVPRNCKIKVGTAESPDACRGGDYNLVHCSEVGLWKQTKGKSPELLVRSACSGVLYEPDTMILFESTANGTGNYFHREYQAAKSGESQFGALFVSWFEIDQYSLCFADNVERREFAERLWAARHSEHSVSDRRQPGRYMWRLWEMGATLEALHWYEKERAKYSDHGLMAAEYPSDDIEAFVHSGARVFDRYKVEALRPACGVNPVRGEVVGLKPLGGESLRGVKFVKSEGGALAVWKFPETDPDVRQLNRYLVVVDIGGRWQGADWSVVAVFDRAGDRPEVVAQWRGHTDFDLLAWNAARIAKFYDDALLVIESNTIETHEPGHGIEGDQSTFLFAQLRRAYPNLYARRQSAEDVRNGVPTKYGFHTNVATKPMIISTLVSVVREGEYVERDQACLDEYLTYEQRPNGSYGALPGHHDDLLMTRAIGLHISIHEMDPVRRRLRNVSSHRPVDPPHF